MSILYTYILGDWLGFRAYQPFWVIQCQILFIYIYIYIYVCVWFVNIWFIRNIFKEVIC